MPVAEAVMAGAQILGQILGNRAQRKAEERSKAFELQMYDRKYQDNLKLWNMQNEYNDPKAQMERLKEAGLNPMLMYGKGAGAGGAGQAGSISSPDANSPTFRAPQWQGVSNALSNYFDLRIKQAQVNNLEAQTTQRINNNLLSLDRYFGKPEVPRFVTTDSEGAPLFPKGSEKWRNWQKGSLMESQAEFLRQQNFAKGIQNNILESFGMKKAMYEMFGTKYQSKLRQMEAEFYKMFGALGGAVRTLQGFK